MYEGWLLPKLSLEFYCAVFWCSFKYFRWCLWCSQWCSPKRRCCFVISVFSVFKYSKHRCYYLCLFAVMRKLDAIIRVRMLLCESLMLLFMSVCCYAKFVSVTGMLLFVFQIMFFLINPGFQRVRPLWSGTSDKLIMPILPTERKLMLHSMAEVARKLSSNN